MSTEKEMIRNEYAKVWHKDQKMVDYCVGKVAALAILPDGGIIPVEKQGIEKNFCFGESGYDYDDAQRAAAHARKSESYFKTENMRHFREVIRDLMEALNGISNYKVTITEKAYYSQDDDCRICSFQFTRLSDIIEARGGSCFLPDLFGEEIEVRGHRCRVATPKEVDLIIEAYKAAAAQHEKKVDAYLKRYGTSKVHSWTYWRDA